MMLAPCLVHQRWRSAPTLCGWLPGFVLAVALSGCQSPAPRSATPVLAARQAAGLKALGFTPTDEGWLLNLPDPIAFAFGKASIKHDEEQTAARTAIELHELGIGRLRIEGHSDNVGPTAVNVDLSQRRAEAVARVFVENDFAQRDVTRRGLGASIPLASNETSAGRARNRRVEIIVPADALSDTP